ncbi:MAG: ATPase with chaperone activity [Burkholderiales bacterium]|nr:ATPase with chaperone activity [Burkholderiales bacterium]
MSSDESQISIPPSFVALFVPPGRIKPNAAREHIAQRYEFCEDLATMLMEPARTQLWQLGVAESDVLERVQRGLLAPDSGVDMAEAHWVVRRLAELLDWT